MTPAMKTYISTKIGNENVDAFKMWALVGMKPNKTECEETLIDKWNTAHPKHPIKQSMNAWDAIDRMVEIWKERFG